MRYVKMVGCILMGLVTGIAFAQSGTSLDERGYGLYVPASYDEDATDALPLVIVLHGFGDTWENFYTATGFVERAESDNFIVAFPQGYLRQWNDGSVGDHYEDDVQLFIDLTERIARDYRVDRERVYLVGFSNGGTMVFHAACQRPDFFAGIAAVAGTMRSEIGEDNGPCADVQIPVAIIHGTADNVVPFDGGPYRYSPVMATRYWMTNNGCTDDDVPLYNPNLFVNGAQTFFFDECAGGNHVLLHVIEEGQHTWYGARDYIRGRLPSPQLDITQLIWSFFDIAHAAREQAETPAEATPEATASPTMNP